ncbi:MAG: HAMP domain-containing protein [Lachnospiraceae bacterium]|nr:HAMP domain-containing protein [Lachnospiraceae bacterium]MDE6185955.1 HAMP domain-containing protein [Lachnospiraceae bacterium]
MEKKSKVSVLSSIKTKIILLIVLSVLATTTLCISRVISVVKENQTALVKNYMKDIALIAGEGIDRELGFADAATVLTAEELGNIIGSLRVEGMDSSYAYVVSDDGTMLYHPTADKIGQPVENDAVKQLLTEIGKGNRPQADVITYEFKGVMKYASFYIGKNMDYIVVVTADEEEAFESINVILKDSVLVSLITLVLWSVVGLLVAVRIVKPIERMTEMTETLSELDFTRSSHQDYVDKRKDETGVMGRSMHVLRDKLTATVTSIATHSNDLYDASTAMNNSAEETALAIEQVEKAIAEIAQGATSQAQETQAATENVILMGNMIEETTEEVEILRDNARKMRDAGNKAIEIIGDLNSINQKTKEAIQVIYDQTNTTNVSAMKIREATDMISDIAEETNLLSLNASIEAARAGEQGRGFAVVASQIQKLAEQSNESARQIDGIINSLIADSEKSVETMEEVKEVIEKQNENVMNTEGAFHEVKDGIDKSIDGIRAIAARTKKLDEARVKVVDVVQNLTAIAEENAASTEETSASAAEVGSIISSIAENAKQLNKIANEMEENIKLFVVE